MMLAVINAQGFFVSYLHQPTESDFAREDVVEVERYDLTDRHRLVNEEWVHEPVNRYIAPPPGTASITGKQ